LIDPAQHALAQKDAIEIGRIALQRDLATRAADDVLVEEMRQLALRENTKA
jgi:hypothetical protein